MEWFSELIKTLPPKTQTWLLVLVISAVLFIILWALKQGREISVWPPKIGPRKDSGGNRHIPKLILQSPASLAELDFARIEWDQEECYLVGLGLRERVRIVPTRIGPSFTVDWPPELIDKVSAEHSYELELRDRKGNRWRVTPTPFFLFENLLHLNPVEPIERILQDYAEESDET